VKYISSEDYDKFLALQELIRRKEDERLVLLDLAKEYNVARRGIIGTTLRDLAKKHGLNMSAVQRIETQKPSPKVPKSTCRSIISARQKAKRAREEMQRVVNKATSMTGIPAELFKGRARELRARTRN
jgi:hypothetical protein